MKEKNIEFKVGFFIVLAIVILSLIVFQVGGVNIFKSEMYKLNVIFDFVSGIEINAPVHFAGVSVGEVKEVAIFYNPEKRKTQVKLVFAIKNDVKIPKDSIAYINTLGILGEKYIEIVPGRVLSDVLKEGDSIVGNNPVQMEKLTESLVEIVGDQTIKDSLRKSFYNMNQATENLLATSQTLNEIMTNIKNGQGTIGRFVKDDSIYTQTEGMVVNLSNKLDKLVTDLNNQLTDLVKDLKKHPWKLLRRPPRSASEDASSGEETAAEKKPKEEAKNKEEVQGNLGYIFKK